MATIQFRRDTAANWTSNNPTLLVGEFGIETDTYKIKIGDGSSTWNDLTYQEIFSPPYVITPVAGSTSGFSSGGFTTTGVNTIQKVDLASDGNSTDWGDLTAATPGVFVDAVSNIPGSVMYVNVGSTPATVSGGKTVDKISTASAANGASGVVTATRKHSGGGAAMNKEKGYFLGGSDPADPSYDNRISRFPFASEGSMINTGDLVTQPANNEDFGTVMDTLNVYTGGGAAGATMIQKFSFASEGNAVDTEGDLLDNTKTNVHSGYGPTHGFFAGGAPGPINVIQSFPFSSEGNTTDVADLATAIEKGASFSSTTHGYIAGGSVPAVSNVVQKYSVEGAGGTNGSDVGDLIAALKDNAGGQV